MDAMKRQGVTEVPPVLVNTYRRGRREILQRLPEPARIRLRRATGRRSQGHANANPLPLWLENHTGRFAFKGTDYLDMYHRHFYQFRGKPVVVVEFGVHKGGSLEMWRDYFGPLAQIHGVDIDPECKRISGPQLTIHIGDQEDRKFLRRLAREIGRIDIVIEDGGHTMAQQVTTFEEIYPRMSKHGVYFAEDLCTSYWPEFGGGHRRPGTFIEHAKERIDDLHACHSRDPGLLPSKFTRTTRCMSVYCGVVVFERGPSGPWPQT
ncbi:MAG: class I SAM-dependent methyltransferase [Sporichthyaceae bacterium]